MRIGGGKMVRRLLSLFVLVLVLGSVAVAPFSEAGNSKKFEKLKDVQVIGDASKKLEKTLAKNFLQVEKGYGNTVNATILLDDGKLTIILQDDVNHDGRWFRIREKVLDKFDINIDSSIVTVYVDGKKTQSQKVEADNDKWIYFYVEHFSTRVITFEASIGYVEYENSVFMDYIEVPDDTGLYRMSFDGVDDYGLIPRGLTIPRPTMIFIFRGENLLEGPKIIRSDPWRYVVGFTSSGEPWLELWDDNGEKIASFVVNYQLKNNTVYFLAFTYGTEGVIRAYINGQLVDTYTALVNNDVGAPTRIYVGTYDESVGWFKGNIYAILIYNRALSDAEVQAIYNDPNNPPLDGLVVWFAPDSVDPTTGKWLDKSGNGNDGTINGTTLVPIAKPVISNVTFDGQNFNITVTTEPATSFVDHVIVPKDLTPPSGINLLAWFYNNELYMTGKSDQFPALANIQHLPEGVYNVGAQQITPTETILFVNSPIIAKKYTDVFIEPTYQYVNVTILSYSKEELRMRASAPSGEVVTFRWRPPFNARLRPVQLIVDGQVVGEKLANADGWVEFTYTNWSTHEITLQGKPYTEISNQFAVLAINGLIGIMMLGMALEYTRVDNELIRKGLIGLAVALFVVFVLTLL